jgi:hypothetical protein
MEARPPSECLPAGTSAPTGAHGPYSPLPAEALRRLGIEVDAPLRDLQAAYRRLLPDAAASGYRGALSTALIHGSVTAGDAEDQLRWLAAHLCVERPADDDPWPWWSRAWRQASDIANVPPPVALDEPARRVLLRELLARPDYGQRLVDALAAAFRAQLNR